MRDETINYISPLHGPDGPKSSKGNLTSSGIPLAGWRSLLHGTKAKGPPSSDLDIVQCYRKDLNIDGGPLQREDFDATISHDAEKRRSFGHRSRWRRIS